MPETFQWRSRNFLTIHGQAWPVEDPLAVVGLIHGLGEHCGRYAHVAEWFNARRVAVVAYDRQGHGLSGGRRGHSAGYPALLDEIAQLMVAIEMRYPEAPVFLYGHSMGGNLLLSYLIQRHPKIRGAVASAPHIRLAFQPDLITLMLGKMMRTVFPGFTQGNGLDVKLLSRDPKVMQAYLADPLVHNRLSAGTGIALLEAAAILDGYSGPLTVPLLLMHGSADGITSPAGTADFARRVQGDVTLKIWDGLYHEIHNEPEWEQVVGFAWDWMQGEMEK